MSSRSVQIIGGDERQRAYVDNTNHGLVMMDEVHANIHRGVFFSSDYLIEALGNGQSEDLLIVVGATSPHIRIIASVSAQAKAAFYEGTTTSNDGTAEPIFNRNRNSANTPVTAIYHNPTTTLIGTKMTESFIPGGTKNQASGSAFAFFEEWILKPNTKYLFRVTNNSGGNEDFSISFDFYEPS